MRRVLKYIIIPLALYSTFFALYAFPSLRHALHKVLADEGDGLQNVWNLWWAHHAIRELHVSPFFTPNLFYPAGTPLFAHTFSLINGLTAVLFLDYLPLNQVYNLNVLAGFILTGLATFGLSYEITRRYEGSLLAGFVATFCSFHFAHAEGHMQLVTFQFVPLFLWMLIRLFTRPTLLSASGAALAFTAVALSDFYYLFYAGVSALFLLYPLRRQWFSREYWKEAVLPITLFTVLGATAVGYVVAGLILSFPLVGAHDPGRCALDLSAPFIPGGHWIFGRLTQKCWENWPSCAHESSVYMGWSIVGLLVYGWKRRRCSAVFKNSGPWIGILSFFFVMALGPFLHAFGHDFHWFILPYALLEKLLPFLRWSGAPVRMMSMVMLSAGILAGIAWSHWRETEGRWTRTMSALLGLLIFEYWPTPIPTTDLDHPPKYVLFLRQSKLPGGVMDMASNDSNWQMAYAAMHGKPISHGIIARTPAAQYYAEKTTEKLFQERRYPELSRVFGLRYFAVPNTPEYRAAFAKYPILFSDDQNLVAYVSPQSLR